MRTCLGRVLLAVLCISIHIHADAQELRLEQLIEKHRAYCRFFQKIAMEYREIRHTFSFDDNSKQWKREDEIVRWDWAYDRRCEMLHCAYLNHADPQKGILHLSYFRNGTNGHIISASASSAAVRAFAPASLQESLDSGATFTLSSKELNFDVDSPLAAFLGMQFTTPKRGYVPVPLDVYLGLFESEAALSSSKDSNGDVLWTVKFPDNGGEETEGSTTAEPSFYQIVFNESKGFCLQQTLSAVPAEHSPASDANTGQRLPILTESVVLEYQKVSADVWLPKRVADGFGTPWSRNRGHESVFYKKHYEIDSVRINAQVKENICLHLVEFSQVIRDDLLTENTGTEKKFTPLSIWGKNNEPAVTFQTQKEYNEYVKQATAYPLPVFHISSTRLFFLVTGMIMVITALLMLYFRRGEKK